MIGKQRHTIDQKGRLIIPAKFRKELGDSFIVTKGLDNCLFAYSTDEWAVLEQKIKALPLSKARELQRFFFANAEQVDVDTQGRILLPADLRQHAMLTKDVMVIGVSNRMEIWDAARWQQMNESFTNETIAEAMDELGF